MGIMDLLTGKKKTSAADAKLAAETSVASAERELAECAKRKDECDDVADMVSIQAEYEIKSRRLAKARAALDEANAAFEEHCQAERVKRAEEAQERWRQVANEGAKFTQRAIELDRLMSELNAQIIANCQEARALDEERHRLQEEAGQKSHGFDKLDSHTATLRATIRVALMDARVSEGRATTANGQDYRAQVGFLFAFI
jgi:DNA repair exonuclease SbcCD ATPase subunit